MELLEPISLVVILVIICVIVVVRGNHISALAKDKHNWITVPAKILSYKSINEGKVVSMGSKYKLSSYEIYQPKRITYVKIEYTVNGRVYRRSVNKKKVGGKTSGTVVIRYLKGHPTYLRF